MKIAATSCDTAGYGDKEVVEAGGIEPTQGHSCKALRLPEIWCKNFRHKGLRSLTVHHRLLPFVSVCFLNAPVLVPRTESGSCSSLVSAAVSC